MEFGIGDSELLLRSSLGIPLFFGCVSPTSLQNQPNQASDDAYRHLSQVTFRQPRFWHTSIFQARESSSIFLLCSVSGFVITRYVNDGPRMNLVCLLPLNKSYKIFCAACVTDFLFILYTPSVASNIQISIHHIHTATMPSLYNLNTQPHSFWDFVASLDDGASRNQPPNHSGNQQNTPQPTAESSKEKASAMQPTVEDDVAAESSSQEKGKAPEAAGQPSGHDQQVPFRGRSRCGGDEAARRGYHAGRAGPCHGRRGRGGFGEPHHHHPSGEGFDGFGDFNSFGMRGPPPFGGFGLFGPAHRGPPPPPGAGHGPHSHHDRPYPPHHHNHRRGPLSGPNGFNLGEFLSNLGSRLGLDLSGAAEGLGLDRFTGSNTNLPEGVDFEPRSDIFDTPSSYLIHLSLPGAKKEDLGVDWDGENSTLRIGGVVHRPGVDEKTLELLAVDGRKTEVGVFEKKIHLGTKRDPANIDIAGITAKMTDGVLVVKVPKVEVHYSKREVPISGSASPSPVREETQPAQPQPAALQHTQSTSGTEKDQAVAEMDIDDARSDTEKGDEMEYDDPAERLPEYKEPGQDDARDSEEEGEYVKIDVK
jgi:HSP20 family protein